MVCEHEYMNIAPPPPNYRARYGPGRSRRLGIGAYRAVARALIGGG